MGKRVLKSFRRKIQTSDSDNYDYSSDSGIFQTGHKEQKSDWWWKKTANFAEMKAG